MGGKCPGLRATARTPPFRGAIPIEITHPPCTGAQTLQNVAVRGGQRRQANRAALGGDCTRPQRVGRAQSDSGAQGKPVILLEHWLCNI